MKERDYLSVSELNAYIKQALEGDPFFSSLYIKAEVSNFKTYPSGHAYFTLKDKDSLISATMWASYRAHLDFVPKDGDEVLVHGRVSVYPPRGSYQLTVDHMERFGEGDQRAKLKALAERLSKEGLFDESRKKKIPTFPNRIGVIAGAGSAGLKDIQTNLAKRWPIAEVCVFPSLVQGKDAPKSLLEALRSAEKENLDTLIIGRGGGSSEDLSAFNDETFVRAVAACKVPVIAAVGHEVDVSLVDLVADLRVSTPTGAAVAATPDQYEIRQTLDEMLDRLDGRMRNRIDLLKQKFGLLKDRSFFLDPKAIYSDKIEKLQEKKGRLGLAMAHRLSVAKEKEKAIASKLEALSPYGVLSRGYSMTMDGEGNVLTSIASVRAGDKMQTRFGDGIIVSTVEGKE